MSQESALSPAVTAMHVAQVEKAMDEPNSMHAVVEGRMKETSDELGSIGQPFHRTMPDHVAIEQGAGEGKQTWVKYGPNLNTLRIATQVRELALQGVTLKNTFKEMQHVWESLMTEDKRCLIVEQEATKVKYQLVNLYAVKLIRYLRSIVGLDLVPLAQQDPETRTWKLDAIILNVASNKVKDHDHLFRMFLVNLFGMSEQLVDLSLEPTWAKYREYIRTVYDFDLGDTEEVTETPDLELIDGAIYNLLSGKALAFF
ncbi:hypothetical protein pETSU_205 [Edwardsiella phage pEt-SU]|uniref:Uncharacterized protein n=1 Tax=Edwardsiella phage pEt-SU TaxID=2562142 RepID=A0A4D6DYB6_9CAUD|nr:hypothetical protein HOV39_gp205 [Edwardsiella phage pEt-SU]QBZ70786.1 hypothetical protein pETSU_205 [Edwardsiella phage pEt-SU]